jgi:HD superfamily phosphohydrolase
MSEVNPLESLRERVSSAVEGLFADYNFREYRGPKIIRDVIWGFINVLPHELALLDSPLFQRLRRVYQTSLALLTYPCSVHSRLEHSLGSLAVADRVIGSLAQKWELS